MSEVAASGGYYIAMSTDKIIAEPDTITGSIGVFGGKLNINGLYKDHLGLNVEAITRGRNADLYSPYTNFTQEQLTKMEESIDDVYKDFITKVAEGRKMKVEAVDAIGQGRIWSGVEGKEKGLVDELGGLTKAIEVVKTLAKMPADSNPQIVEYPKASSIVALFDKDADDNSDSDHISKETRAAAQRALLESAAQADMPADFRDTMRALALVRQLNNEHVFALMPYQLSIR
jgi:protease-4